MNCLGGIWMDDIYKHNLTAIGKWGVEAPCFDKNGEYIELEIPNLFKEE